RIVNRWHIAARANRNLPAGARKQVDGCFLQTTFGNAKFQARPRHKLVLLPTLTQRLQPIDRSWLERPLRNDSGGAVFFQAAIEAAAIPFVAHAWPGRTHLYQ